MKTPTLAMQLGPVLGLLARSLMLELKQKGHDLTMDQVRLFMMLNYKGEIIQQELAEILNKDKSAVLRQIDILEEKGLICRIPDAVDRRKKNLGSTELGQALYAEILTIDQSLEQQFFQGISESEQQSFRRILYQVRRNGESHLGLTANSNSNAK